MQIYIGPNEAGQRLDKFLRKYLKEVPLSRIFKGIRKGDIRVNGKKEKEKYVLELDDVLEIKYMNVDDAKSKVKKFNKVNTGKLKITYEDENMLLIEKWHLLIMCCHILMKEEIILQKQKSHLHQLLVIDLI